MTGFQVEEKLEMGGGGGGGGGGEDGRNDQDGRTFPLTL